MTTRALNPLVVTVPQDDAARTDRSVARNFLPLIKLHRWLLIVIFLLAGALRLLLAMVNQEANDNHMPVIEIIMKEGRLPTKADGWEGFQPKLFHVVVAALCKPLPSGHRRLYFILAQLLNAAAGMATVGIVWRFLQGQALSDKVKLVSFSMVALNPGLMGINAQVTNDSFVILFATASLYYLYLFFASSKPKHFIGLTVFSILAGLSKGNGLALFPGILLAFGIKLMKRGGFSFDPRKGCLAYVLIFSFVYLVTVPLLGQYYYNYRHFGSPFVINQDPDPVPHFFEKTYCRRPGVTSIVDSYLTFRFVDMLETPTAENPDGQGYPLHRTSLWSQLYGKTHFLFFESWPPSWKARSAMMLNLGRVTLILGVIPMAILFGGAFQEARRWWRGCLRDQLGFVTASSDWVFGIFFLGYLLFIVAYTLHHRDCSCMKVLFLFPAMLPAAFLFSEGLAWVYGKLGRGIVLLETAFVLLGVCYVSSCVVLILRLAKQALQTYLT